MNYDPKSVGESYSEMTCAWTTFLRLGIPPWLGQCLDMVH
jgi:hypothetical protein